VTVTKTKEPPKAHHSVDDATRDLVDLSSSSQSAQGLMNHHHATLHAFFLAARESGYTEFELQLVGSPKGRMVFCIGPRGHSEMSATFDVRGNTVRVALSEASSISIDDADVRIDYGGTRSGEEPVRISPGSRSSPSRQAAVTDRDPQEMDWSPSRYDTPAEGPDGKAHGV
jgi:hypothetical protein